MSEGPISPSDPAPGRASWFAGVRALAVAGGVALAAAGLLSCGDSSTGPAPRPPPPPPPPPPPVATTVAVSPAAAQLSSVGETVRLSAEVRDQNGRAMPGATVTWTSSDPSVVSVDASGLVTAAGDGTATVTAASGSASGTATVSVEQSVERVTVTPDSAALVVGDTVRMSAAAFDALGNEVAGASFTWSSGDTLVATVDSSGLATGIATGAVEITATSSGLEGRARLVVAVAAPTTVAVTPDSVSLMALGDTVRLSAEVLDQAGRPMPGAAVAWSSADPAVVSVDSTGLVRAEGSGATTVTSTAGSASGSASVSVMQSVSSVTVTPAEASIGPGDTLRLAAQALDANGHVVAGAEFSWSSSDESVATVDGSGLVRGIAEGATTITATTGDADGTSEITIANPDRAALVALYEATDGPNWVNSDNWLTDAPLGEWYGVRTDGSGRVVSLQLYGTFDQAAGGFVSHGLSGSIPLELGNLVNLRWLDLKRNALSGPIPRELGNLVNLEVIELERNVLSGPIPPELGTLVNLSRLDLDYNALSGPIPRELGKLVNIHWLDLSSNTLSGPIPPELGDLGNLRRLSLSSNALSGPIPSELGHLAKLELVALGNNKLSGPIPPELGKLASLRYLDLEANEFSGRIPPELGNLVNLEWLALQVNALSGPIPPELGQLAKLESMFFGSNNLAGRIPPELGNLTNLRQLHLAGNDLDGPIPQSIMNLPLETFFWDCGLPNVCAPGTSVFVEWLGGLRTWSGPFCSTSDRAALSDLFALTKGEEWAESTGWLEGAALEEWHAVRTDSLGRVTGLHLSDNGLSGELPDVFGALPQLTEIWVDGNALRGRLPLSLTRLDLHAFDYTDTELCEPAEPGFQAWLSGIASHKGTGLQCEPLTDRDVLVRLYGATDGPNWKVSTNWLTDAPLGEWYGVDVDDQGRVIRLHLQGNRMSGNIPPELGRLASLTELDLFNNDLSGSVPLELGRLTQMKRLVLTANGLSGTIPAELGRLANLTELRLNDNKFSGTIPMELGGLRDLGVLHLGVNDLSGPIPPELGGLANLWLLNLWRNDLSGSIPGDLGGLADLLYLFLGENDISGPIPAELGALANLTELRLNDNNLSGPVPPEIGDLANLAWLTLGGNALSGPIPPELGKLTNLTGLHVFFNQLSGPIPPKLGDLVRLETLALHDNNLSGSLPSELGRMRSLTELDVTNNAAMSGPLPTSLTDLGNLETLYARGTGLCAPGDDAGLRAWIAGVPEVQMAACAPVAAYLVQAVQSREFPVPLVAGEEALLRVFVTAVHESAAGMPLVRAHFYLNGRETHAVEIAGSSVPIRTEIDEGDMSRSANAVIPGDVVRPGLEMVIEVDPNGTLDPTLGVAGRIPAMGRLAVEVREMPPFDLTVIPFLWASEPDSSVIGIAEGMASDPAGHELLAATRTLLPVADIAVTAHAPVTISSNFGFDVLQETAAIQVLEGGDGHHMGLMVRFSDTGGLGAVGGRLSVSETHGGVIAHELGHNMSLWHAPCGAAWDLDPRYPYPGGSLGAWGYDFPGEHDIRRGGEPVNLWTADLMSYCHPSWISDYHFTKALRYRLLDEGPPAASVAAAQTRSLLVWGGMDPDGEAFLNPAFVVDAPVALPDSAGAYSVTGRDAGGGELFSLSFAMPVLADAEGASSFVFAVPAEAAWEGRLASVTLSGPDGEVVLDGETNRPMAILRDPASGQVRGFFSELSQDVGTAAAAAVAIDAEPGLRVLFSRGIPDAAAWGR